MAWNDGWTVITVNDVAAIILANRTNAPSISSALSSRIAIKRAMRNTDQFVDSVSTLPYKFSFVSEPSPQKINTQFLELC